jgi:hypothetical protein
MQSVPDIFAAFGGPAAMARALQTRASTASEMKRRGSIPAEYWVRLVDAAKEAGIDGVTYEALARAHAKRRAA